jgi:hypothetical protein
MTIVYDRTNGYEIIDTNAEPFQLGRRLYEAQRLLSQTAPYGDKPLDAEKAKEVANWFCALVAEVGFLRASYSMLADVIRGRAEYRYEEDGVEYEVRRAVSERWVRRKAYEAAQQTKTTNGDAIQ